MSACITAFIDFPFMVLLIIAKIVSNTGNANTISGATITIAVYVFATPKIDITAKLNPKKFDPVSPIKVFAGLKLKGINPDRAPARAVINIIAITGESFNENIINNDTHEMIDIPEDNPSNPSIRFIAFVIPIIQPKVIITETASLNPILLKNGKSKFSILIPLYTTTIAAINCPASFVRGGIPFTSSKKHVRATISIPHKKPSNLKPYCSVPIKFIVCSKFITITK